jgi:hypothetical protein
MLAPHAQTPLQSRRPPAVWGRTALLMEVLLDRRGWPRMIHGLPQL